jgi:hypothetical protein
VKGSTRAGWRPGSSGRGRPSSGTPGSFASTTRRALLTLLPAASVTATTTVGRSIVSYVVQGTKQTLECEIEIDKHLPTDKLVEVCKQMHER